MKKTGAIAILTAILGLPSSGYVVKYAWDRIEKNTEMIQNERIKNEGFKNTIKSMSDDIRIIKEHLINKRK